MRFDFGDLFDQPPENTEDWRNETSRIRVGALGYRTKTILSGDILEAEVYPIYGREDTHKARAAKKNLTPEKKEKAAMARSRKRLGRLLNANFTQKDYHLTTTYEVQPESDAQMDRDARNFVNRVKRAMRRKGLPETKYVYVPESTDGEKSVRPHLHWVISGGLSREELEDLWGKGRANANRLQPGEDGLNALANYMTKGRRGKRKWRASKNLKQPKEHVSDCKLSRRKVQELAKDLPAVSKPVLEKVYPGYVFTDCQVRWSEETGGVFVWAVMRRCPGGERKRGS